MTLQDEVSMGMLFVTWARRQVTSLTERDGGAELRGEEAVNPTLTGEPPGVRPCHVDDAVPITMPVTREALARFQEPFSVEKLPALRLQPAGKGSDPGSAETKKLYVERGRAEGSRPATRHSVSN